MAITLNSVVYNWVGFDPSGTSRWTATAGGVATSFSNLTNRTTAGLLSSDPKTARTSKSKWRIEIPVIASETSTTSPPGTVLRTAYVEVTADFHPTSTTAERTDALARLKALVLLQVFTDSFVSLSQPAGT